MRNRSWPDLSENISTGSRSCALRPDDPITRYGGRARPKLRHLMVKRKGTSPTHHKTPALFEAQPSSLRTPVTGATALSPLFFPSCSESERAKLEEMVHLPQHNISQGQRSISTATGSRQRNYLDCPISEWKWPVAGQGWIFHHGRSEAARGLCPAPMDRT